ncbi:hypothetical protein [Methylomonas methanica]|uniref:Uncharacterized protein n=1 Tax=Methylomonas methanica (strain DSM 25384 / MC09) TaxID=857087 RepID=G0A052_METMM|nr:hypothetical protein [Methylomonas methanica]AEG01191.1 hypothetical protein Metme_2809 [Methylomonas methanica MC09]
MSVGAIICYLKSLSDDEIISINKYWTLNDSNKNEFKYTLTQIDEQRDPKCSRVSVLVNKSSCLINNPAFFCKVCKQAKPVKNRTELMARLRLSSFQCQECEQKQISVLREESIKILRNFISDALKKTDYFHRLSYIDKLILLTMLFDNYQEKKPIISSDARLNITGSENVDIPALSRLVKIGALVKIVDLPEEVAHAETKFHESSLTTVSRLRRNRYMPRSQRNQFAIERGIYFSLPLGFNNSAEFIEKIYNDIVSGGIAANEVTDLKRMVIDMRIENFYRLIDHIAHDFNLEISNSVPLSALLSHLAERYPITKCYYTFHRYAKEVVLYMHKNDPPSYSRCHLFTKFVSNYT